jgi:hypothetical protein
LHSQNKLQQQQDLYGEEVKLFSQDFIVSSHGDYWQQSPSTANKHIQPIVLVKNLDSQNCIFLHKNTHTFNTANECKTNRKNILFSKNKQT